MKVTRKSIGSNTLLSLEGVLTIEEMDTLKEILLTAMNEAVSLEVQLDRVDRVDLSGLQIILSAIRSFRREEKELRLIAGAESVFWRTVRESGYQMTFETELVGRIDNTRRGS